MDRIRFVATSATRDARNRDIFLDGVRSRLGVTPEVISGHEEASLSFRGVVSAVTDAPQPQTNNRNARHRRQEMLTTTRQARNQDATGRFQEPSERMSAGGDAEAPKRRLALRG